MKYRSIVVSSLLAALTGCGGGGGGTPAAAPALPTVTAVQLDDRQQKSLEPLADGIVWTYACTSGSQQQITAAKFGSVAGADTFLLTTPLPVGRSASSAGSSVFANDENGNLSYFGFVRGGTFTSVLPSVRAEDANPSDNASYQTADQNGGTVTTKYQGTVPLSVPAGSYDTAYHFHLTFSKNANIFADIYDVRGVGTVRIDYTNGSATDSCKLSSVNIAPRS